MATATPKPERPPFVPHADVANSSSNPAIRRILHFHMENTPCFRKWFEERKQHQLTKSEKKTRVIVILQRVAGSNWHGGADPAKLHLEQYKKALQEKARNELIPMCYELATPMMVQCSICGKIGEGYATMCGRCISAKTPRTKSKQERQREKMQKPKPKPKSKSKPPPAATPAQALQKYHDWLRTRNEGTLVKDLAGAQLWLNPSLKTYMNECVAAEVEKVLPDPNLRTLSVEQLRACYEILDRIVYAGLLKTSETDFGFISATDTTTAGSCSTQGSRITIKMNRHMFLHLSVNAEGKMRKMNNGKLVEDKRAAFMCTLEHEAVHAFMRRWTPSIPFTARSPGFGPHGSVFKAITLLLHDHTTFKHSLSREQVGEPVTRADVKRIIKANDTLEPEARTRLEYVDQKQNLRFVLAPDKANPTNCWAKVESVSGTAPGVAIPYSYIGGTLKPAYSLLSWQSAATTPLA